MIKSIVQHRRGTTEEWLASTVIPRDGELIIEECADGTKKVKIGNNKDLFSNLPYISDIESPVSNEIIELLQEDVQELVEKTTLLDKKSAAKLHYVDSWLSLKDKDGLDIGAPVYITGGGGSSFSKVKLENSTYVDGELSRSLISAIGNPVPIKFTFTSLEQDEPTGDIVCSIKVGTSLANLKEVYFKELPQGLIEVDISEYLVKGDNKVVVTCTDIYSVSRSLEYSVSVKEIVITPNFYPNVVFKENIGFNYKVSGASDLVVTINYLLDGEVIYREGVLANGTTKTYIFPLTSHGLHTIGLFASVMLNGVLVETLPIEYKILCAIENNDAAMLYSTCSQTKVEQGTMISIPYKIYNPTKSSDKVSLVIDYKKNGVLTNYSTKEITIDTSDKWSATESVWHTPDYPVGEVTFSIVYEYNFHGELKTLINSYNINVDELKLNEPITDSQVLYLSSKGRDNGEANPAIWEYEYKEQVGTETKITTISTTFEDFNWKSNGWVKDENNDTCLRLNGDARLNINFKPFEKAVGINGKTIEIEFAVRDVNQRDLVVIDCMNADGTVGFNATADTAMLCSSGNISKCNYKDAQKTRISFVIDGMIEGDVNQDRKFITTYLDGTLTSILERGSKDTFLQQPAKTIKIGSSACGIDVYSIRVYNRALTYKEICDNYIGDQSNLEDKKQLFNDNNIYDNENKGYYRDIDYVKVKQRIPTVTLIGSLPKFKGNKKKNKVRMIFERPEAYANYDKTGEVSTPIYDAILDQLDVQGTSSADYPRKNWKAKTKDKVQLIPGELAAKVYCIKVDYAESTGTHNTQNANYVETLYSEPLPPLQNIPSSFTPEEITDIQKTRTTITGFPIALFHLDMGETDADIDAIRNLTIEDINNNPNVKFYSKGNFNFDKGAEDVFAFNDNCDVECWEFKDNKDPQSFLTAWPENCDNYWEPRYHKDLGTWEDLTDKLKPETYDPVAGKVLFDEMIVRFKEMYNWVYSTARGSHNGIPFATSAPIEHKATWDAAFTVDNDEYRLAKFKNEFSNYFNIHYTLIYYVYTFFSLMVDQRAKNLFLTYWHDNAYDSTTPGKWFPYFYDNDTCFGIDNVGQLKFDYFHEDDDKIGTADIYNGQNSVLWCNFRDAFQGEIKAMYQSIRGDDRLTYNKLISQFIEKGSDAWSAAIYNEDAHYKYISIATKDSDYDSKNDGVIDITADHLAKARGTGEQHLKYFLKNRIDYCDSKWDYGSYSRDDTISFRAYRPTYEDPNKPGLSEADKLALEKLNHSIEIVPPSLDITVKPYSTMYLGVKFGSSNPLLPENHIRVSQGTEHTFISSDGTVNDLDTYIVGASHISEINDLAPLYPGFVNVSKAEKLVNLKVGDGREGYCNLNLTSVSLDQNRLLRTLDVQNCPNLSGTLNVKNCLNIENIYAFGSGITDISLPAAGYIKKLQLPETMTKLVIENQPYLEDDELQLMSLSNLTDVAISNCNLINTHELLDKLILFTVDSEDPNDTVQRYKIKHLKLDNLKFGDKDANEGVTLEYMHNFDGIYGYDNQTGPAELYGTCHLVSDSNEPIDGNDFLPIKEKYKNTLEFTYNSMTSKIKFCQDNGEPYIVDGVEYTQTISGGMEERNAYCPEEAGIIPTPTRDPDAKYSYKFKGWTTKWYQSTGKSGEYEKDALDNIEADRVVYPAFESTLQSYVVNFINPSDTGDVVLQSMIVEYGSDAEYTGSYFEKLDTETPESFNFTGWYPSPKNITGPRDCYAQFKLSDGAWYVITPEDIDYTLGANTMAITKYKNAANNIVRIPEKLTINDKEYTITTVGGFRATNIEYIDLPETVVTLSANAFAGCAKLAEINFPSSLKIIGDSAFNSCANIEQFKITEGITTIEQSALSECKSLKDIKVDPNNKLFKMVNDCLIYVPTGMLLQGMNTSTIPQDGSIKLLGRHCFASTDIESINLPEGIPEIPNNAFSNCKRLTSISIPESVAALRATCFGWCENLTEVYWPTNKLVSIMTWVFNDCNLETVSLPASVKDIHQRSFAENANLKEFTFNSMPTTLREDAFQYSGHPDGFIINVPWNKADIPGAPWGAQNATVNYGVQPVTFKLRRR